MFFKGKKKIISVGIGIAVILVLVGTVGALNGWFGGGGSIPSDTMTRGLVGYWSFDEQTGPLVFDKSGQGNDGMINDGGSGNPVSYWTFDEGSGSTAYDYTGSNNGTLGDGTCQPGSGRCPAWTSSGRVGGALEFDGTNDDVNISSFSLTSNAITVEAWIKHDTLPASIQRYVTVASEVAVIRHNGGQQLHFYIKTDGTLKHLTVDNALETGKWYHIVGTWDGTTQRFYKNGVEIAS